ncbi:MAG: hypothetical protein R3B82_15370 [Sandaracinaceae bacterium]
MPFTRPGELHADVRVAATLLAHDLNNALTLLDAGVEATLTDGVIMGETERDLSSGLDDVQRIGRKLQLLSGRRTAYARVGPVAEAVERGMAALGRTRDDVALDLDGGVAALMGPRVVEDILDEVLRAAGELGCDRGHVAVFEEGGEGRIRVSFPVTSGLADEEGARIQLLDMLMRGWAMSAGGRASFYEEGGQTVIEVCLPGTPRVGAS